MKYLLYEEKFIDDLASLWLRNNQLTNLSQEEIKAHLLWKYNLNLSKIFLAIDANNKVRGCCGSIRYPLILHNQAEGLGCWGVDALTDNNLTPNEKISTFLTLSKLTFFDLVKEKNNFVFCFPNEKVKNTYLKIGWKPVPSFWNFKKIISNYQTTIPEASELSTYKGILLTPIKSFLPIWDRYWKNLYKDCSLISLRTAKLLNWRYINCSRKHYNAFIIQDNEDIKGYVILRIEQKDGYVYGHITDLFLDLSNKNLFDNVLKELIILFKKFRVQIIQTSFSHHYYKKMLIKYNFLPIKKIDLFIFCQDNNIGQEELSNANKWAITAGDGDFDME